MMNRIFACFLIAFVVASPAFSVSARADDASHLKAAEDLLAVTNMSDSFNKSLDQILAMQVRAAPQLAPYQDVMRAFFAKYISWDAMKDDIAKLYVENFSEQELKDITAFYQTPTGKKAIEVMPTLFAKGAQLGQQRVQEHSAELQQMLMEAIQKRKQQQQQEAAPANAGQPAPTPPAEPVKP